MSRIVDQKFIGLISSRLNLFTRKGKFWTFRCPFCGDSKKNKRLCRAYFFEYKGAILFKCHNCSLSFGLSSFLAELDPQLAKSYHFETFQERGGPRHSYLQEAFHISVVATALPPLPLKRISDLSTDHPARVYVRNRKFPLTSYSYVYYTDNMRELESLAPDRYNNVVPRDARVVLPYYHENKLVGLTGRAIDPKTQKRYIQMKFVDDVPLVFGLQNLQSDKHTYIVEGPIDSLFLPNAIACGGIDCQKIIDANYVERERTTIIFDNQPRNKEVVRRMSSMVDKRWAVVVWPYRWAYKDVNEAVMSGISPEIVKNIIDEHTHYGLALEMAIKAWRR